MRLLATAAFGLIAMGSAAAACPTYSQTGASYTYTGQQLYSPQSFGVTAGGQYNIRNCNIPGVNRTGYVTAAPDFSFYLSGMDPYYLVADVVSQCDAVLLVNTANATWMFDDDSNGNLDPRLEIRGAQNLNGRVDVWVGTYNNSYCDATLNMETWYAQAPAPTPTPTPTPTPQPAGGCPSWAQPGQQMYLTGQQLYSPQRYNVTAGGTTNISSCGVGGRGYANQVPHYSFNLSGMENYGRLEIEVTNASCDTTLLVNTPSTQWYFDDDSRGNLQPLLNIPSSASLNGRLDLWVGTYNGSSCQATVELETWHGQVSGGGGTGGGFTPAPTPTPTPTPTPAPAPQPAGGCPSWQQPGTSVYLTGQQLYSPQRYNVQAGGSTNISSCGVGGRGYANQVPHYSFNLSGMESYGRLEIEVEASCDTTLLVNTPSTQWYFDDDSGGSLQPLLNIPSSASLNGRLDLWVGTYSGNTCPATVELETWHGAAGGGGGTGGGNTGACPSWQQPGTTVYLTGQQLYSPQRYNVQAGGSNNISSCGVGGRGYANTVPHYSFNLSGMESYGRLEIEVEASCDTTLLVNTPSTQWYFDDDSNGNLQPLLNIPSSASLNGRLDVWVGTYSGSTCPATLELETWYN